MGTVYSLITFKIRPEIKKTKKFKKFKNSEALFKTKKLKQTKKLKKHIKNYLEKPKYNEIPTAKKNIYGAKVTTGDGYKYEAETIKITDIFWRGNQIEQENVAEEIKIDRKVL